MQASRNFKRHRFGGWRMILSFVLKRVDGRRMISYPQDEKERVPRPMKAGKQMSGSTGNIAEAAIAEQRRVWR
jgi:hypothetical protein